MLSECACLNVRKAARVVTQRYDDALRPAGVRSTQLPLLATAALRGRINLAVLADEVVIDRTTLSRTLALLERKGWIRVSQGADRRTRDVRLTQRGWDVLQRAVPLWERVQAEIRNSLGGARFTRLVAGFRATVAAAKQD